MAVVSAVAVLFHTGSQKTDFYDTVNLVGLVCFVHFVHRSDCYAFCSLVLSMS